MTAPAEEKEQQERLREAAALGDILQVRSLVESGVSVNSQNEINGWTCLHWACKRNHGQVVSYLLLSGADREILTVKGERPAQLTSRGDIRKILGVEDTETAATLELKRESELPFIPSYLANPPFPFTYTAASASPEGATAQIQSGGPSASPPAGAEIPRPGAFPGTRASLPLAQNGAVPTPSVSPTAPPTPSTPPVPQRMPESTKPSPGCQPLSGHTCPLFSPIPPKPPVPMESHNGPSVGPPPTFQPFFFTGTFPFNVQELVLKVRIQNPSLRENDFIEIELDRQELTYQELLRVSCRELGVSPEHVEKIRKLPNTLLRKDKDVARLQDFQELELVLTLSDSNFLLRNAASTLTERPCYNRRASKLTY
ncbi:ankyrin repeat domain-containing protein 40 [Tachyglossus aculeatus]|uniref:ankyrin repeat domain-containing protein 40 n=1 Tax=Tachyglossus aculeatus TaxID=9261 RepID=UPI0018F2A491|nr:ankyrin repeat domain-containing protein 40 [Tachyglossus aculeatus]